MIPFFFTGSIVVMLIIWAVYAACYSGILRKMGAENWYSFVPVAAEWRMSKVLFAGMWSFYHAALSALVFLGASYYVGKSSVYYVIFWLAGIAVYSIFLEILNWRISSAFNMGILFHILMLLFPIPCLLYLGFSRAQFTAPEFMIRHAHPIVRFLINGTIFLFTAAEFLCLVAVVGFFSITEKMPRPLVEYLINDTNETMGNVTEQGKVVRREDVLDAESAKVAAAQRSRDYFAPDHSADQSVIVMEYIIGTDLESKKGLTSLSASVICSSAVC